MVEIKKEIKYYLRKFLQKGIPACISPSMAAEWNRCRVEIDGEFVKLLSKKAAAGVSGYTLEDRWEIGLEQPELPDEGVLSRNLLKAINAAGSLSD